LVRPTTADIEQLKKGKKWTNPKPCP